MRIELRDTVGYSHYMTSENPATIGLWLAEMAWKIMNASNAYQCYIQVWPTSERETQMLGHPAQIRLTDKLLEDLAFALNSHE
jgi:hypothetical protein